MNLFSAAAIIAACASFTLSAQTNHIPAPVKDINGVIDNTPDSINKARTARPIAGSSRVGNNPVLFLVGNSTMRTGTMGNGDNGQWGWGYFMGEYFDPEKITVENHALGGMSSRTFYTKLWDDVKKGIRPGDWVIIELGHNDNGPYDSGRARASIPGTGTDSIEVTIKETGVKETVYSYGEYLRRYIRETRALGGKPILFSLTPRKAWDDKAQKHITRCAATFGGWAKEVAQQENVPFVDLNDITARKFETFGPGKVEYMFYLDRIHTSAFGARVNAESAVEGLRKSGLPLADCLIPEPVDTVTGATRRPGIPMLFTIGDSTVKNKDRDDEMWGWGSVIAGQFDPEKITVENHAMAGRSARTFLDEGRWEKVYKALQPGDFVIMQFGHNDLGDINVGKARGELWGYGPDSKVFKMEKTGINQVIYTFGWYLRKFIMDAQEKGAIPVVVSHTPRNKWKNGIIESNAEGLGEWTRQVALQTGAYFVDLNRLSGQMLQEIGPEKTPAYFRNDHTHTSRLGAELNAANIAFALRNTDCPLQNYLKPIEKKTYLLAQEKPFVAMNGSGFDFNTSKNYNTGKPFIWSVRVPNGNYKVTVRLGNKKHSGSTVVRAESRRMMAEPVETKKGKYIEQSFIVNKRDAYINKAQTVSLNPREKGITRWDEKLSLEFNGEYPVCESITIEPVNDITTVYLFGNSTVVDQDQEPYASWGQIIPYFFDQDIVVANHAESGQSANTFNYDKRAAKALSTMKPGDYVFIEFGHNDQKQRGPGKGAYYSFMTSMKTLVDQVREKGAKPVLVTPTSRRAFDKNGHIINTHGEYIDAVRFLAKHDSIPLIELNPMTAKLYEAMGVENSKKAFVHYPAGTFPGQDKALADNTHFNPFGAYEVARCVVEGIRSQLPELATHITDTRTFNPATPDDPTTFYWPLSPFVNVEKPLGN